MIKDFNILNSQIIVIKIGSSILTTRYGFNKSKLKEIMLDVISLKKKKIKIVIVASGAVSLGMEYLDINDKDFLTINEKQAIASCGQILLMRNFQEIFDTKKIKISQVLLTFSDTEVREHSLNARDTINTLLKMNIIPVINENDTVADEELKFGDNDRLAARVAQIINADLLILLSDVSGLFDKNPNKYHSAKLVPFIKKIDRKILNMASNETNEFGSGGMYTKIQAAKIAMNSGCDTLICSGKFKRPVKTLIDNPKKNYTLFISKKIKKKNYFKNWLAGSIKINGKLIIDDGACEALKNGASLLPSGVISSKGIFRVGDVVEIFTKKKNIVAKGIISYDCNEVKKIVGKRSEEIKKILGYMRKNELIHRDFMILEN